MNMRNIILSLLTIIGATVAVNSGALHCPMDKYKLFPNVTMTMCLLPEIWNIPHQRQSETNQILQTHNQLRSHVKPGAADMVQLSYFRALAILAQKWAHTCSFTHDEPIQRFQPGNYQVGQNIAVLDRNASWPEVIDIWKNESSKFNYNSHNDPAEVGNYTQMVRSTTSDVGCGKEKCGSKYFYVCDYAPSRHDADINRPYKSGKSCSACPRLNCTNNFCECHGVICFNGGTLNFTTCDCDCNPNVKTYYPSHCVLNCTNGADNPACGSGARTKATCTTDPTTMENCPNMCHICPYAGSDYRQGSVRLPWETTTRQTTVAASSTPPSGHSRPNRQGNGATGSSVTSLAYIVGVAIVCTMAV